MCSLNFKTQWVVLLLATIATTCFRGCAGGDTVDTETRQPSGNVERLTDLNFDGLTEALQAPWLIAVTAPWCVHCQELKPMWKHLADQLKTEVHVGQVDGTADPVLQKRFVTMEYPSIYYLRGEETRHYRGPRTTEHILKFIDGGWKDVKAVPSIQSPVSPYGRMHGKLRMIPYNLRLYYNYLHHDRKYSVLTLLAAFLSVPVVFGLLTICALDAFFTRSVRQQQHQHQQ